MTAAGSGQDQEMTLLSNRLAIAEETLRALLAGEADAIVMDTGQGEQQIYTLETEAEDAHCERARVDSSQDMAFNPPDLVSSRPTARTQARLRRM
jgi:ABC-type amino acid transport substrate-binding protein